MLAMHRGSNGGIAISLMMQNFCIKWPIRMQRNVCANGLHNAAEDTFPEVIYSGGGASLVFCRAGRAAQFNCSHSEYSQNLYINLRWVFLLAVAERCSDILARRRHRYRTWNPNDKSSHMSSHNMGKCRSNLSLCSERQGSCLVIR